MRKEITAGALEAQPALPAGWIDLAAVASVRLTSEDPHHPIEAALTDPAAAGWRAAHPGEQTIWISLHPPQRIRQINVAFRTTEARTQEFHLCWSSDGGVSYQELVRQQFNFSPATPSEEENYACDLAGVTDLKLVINPDIADASAHAALRYLRLR